VCRTYSSTSSCLSLPLQYQTAQTYPLETCYEQDASSPTGTPTSFMYKSCNGTFSSMRLYKLTLFTDTFLTYAVYTDPLCQSSTYSLNYIQTNACSQSQQYYCSSYDSSPNQINTGYFTTNNYYTSNNCDSYAQSTVAQLGVCVATSFTSAYMYYNYSQTAVQASQSKFSVTYAEYANMNCSLLSTSSQRIYPTTTTYSTSCVVINGVYTSYGYTEEFPVLTNGVVIA
jgi:hypothetical protein